jgi:hypothetical protein
MSGWFNRIRMSKLLVSVLLCLSVAGFVWQVSLDAETRTDYVWDFFQLWAWELLFVSSCYSLGTALLRPLVTKGRLSAAERISFTFTLGVVGFGLLQMLAGALGLFTTWFAVTLPVVLLLLGLGLTLRENGGKFTGLRLSLSPVVVGSPASWAILVFGGLALAFLYVPLLSAHSVSTDAAWFHLSAAEEYAREGRIVPFFADYAKCLPQLSSFLQVWAFLVPGLPETQSWVLALHTEFSLFVGTLVGVVALAQFILPSQKMGLSWVAFFLFPSIFIYDSNLGGAGDHIHAFFMIPHVLASLRAIEERSFRWGALAGLCAGAGLLTKLQASYVIVPLACVYLGAVAVALFKKEAHWKRLFLVFMLYGGTMSILMMPHWIKNWRFYQNPMYPFLQELFPSPFSFSDSGQFFVNHYPPIEHPEFWPHLVESVKTTLTHPFTTLSPHAPQRPYIGALFVLLTPVACVSRSLRSFRLLFVCWGALAFWAYAFPSGRNIQTFLPLLVAMTAVALGRSWAAGFGARVLVVALVVLQLSSSLAHVVGVNQGKISDVFRLINTRGKDAVSARYSPYRSDFRGIRESVPEDGVVLLHTAYSQLGIQRRTLMDWPGFQGLMDYRPARTPRQLYEILHAQGITHIVIDPRWPAHSRQEDVLFSSLVTQYAKQLGRSGAQQIWEMPSEAPPIEPPYEVVLWGVPRAQDGLFPMEHLDQLDAGPPLGRKPKQKWSETGQLQELLSQASGAVIGSHIKVAPVTRQLLADRFRSVAKHSTYQVYALKRKTP